MKNPEYKIINIDDVIPTPQNPRVVTIKQPKVIELAESIKQSSSKMAYEPILVRIHPTEQGKYDLRDGERRLCASKVAGCKTIPALIHEWTDEEAFEVTVILNLQREQLTAMEESRACKYLIESGDDIETAAARLGKSTEWVKRRASLTRIIDNFQDKIDNDPLYATWGMGHLEIIAKLDPESQQKFLDELDDEWNFPHTIKELKDTLQDGKFYLVDASFALDIEIAGKLPCLECPKRSSCTPELPGFEDKKSDKDMCFDPECYKEKALATFDMLLTPWQEKHPDLVLFSGTGHDYEFSQTYNIQYDWNYEKAKKSENGAVPCLVVNLNKKTLGKKVTWKIKSNSSSLSSSEPKKKAQDMTLVEKRKGLNKKRIKQAMTMLSDDLSECNYEVENFTADVVKLENLICLVVAIHSTYHNAPIIIKEYKKIKKAGTGVKMLIDWIQSELKQTLNTDATLDHIDDKSSKLILGLIKGGNKQWQAYMDDAAEAIPEPKSWTKTKESEKKK